MFSELVILFWLYVVLCNLFIWWICLTFAFISLASFVFEQSLQVLNNTKHTSLVFEMELLNAYEWWWFILQVSSAKDFIVHIV